VQKRKSEDDEIYERVVRFQTILVEGRRMKRTGRRVSFMPVQKEEIKEEEEEEQDEEEEEEEDDDDNMRMKDLAEKVNLHTKVIDALIAVVQRTHLDVRGE
jgi:cbb3-type cytochrome oxidase cytochrome c subunit